ncbi:MAG TPA: alpha/beta fold hydrolase, partial [Terriglobales bacterium]|nr:alpha/beta fold hydrolase [Terriglobales bacterium]
MALLIATPASAESSKIITESYYVASHDPGIQLYVRNKHPEGITLFSPDRILLFVHGATYPSEAVFDLPVGGFSWMDYIAQRGWDVYLMDVRGYGRSTRPPEMNQPPTANPPVVNTDIAVKDFATVVDHILVRRSVPRINVMGWSWGTVIVGAYTAQNNDKVERLILYAPIWLRQTPSLIQGEGAYRSVTMETARQRWLQGVPADKQKELIPDGWFEAWWKALLESDPVG